MILKEDVLGYHMHEEVCRVLLFLELDFILYLNGCVEQMSDVMWFLPPTRTVQPAQSDSDAARQGRM